MCIAEEPRRITFGKRNLGLATASASLLILNISQRACPPAFLKKIVMDVVFWKCHQFGPRTRTRTRPRTWILSSRLEPLAWEGHGLKSRPPSKSAPILAPPRPSETTATKSTESLSSAKEPALNYATNRTASALRERGISCLTTYETRHRLTLKNRYDTWKSLSHPQ